MTRVAALQFASGTDVAANLRRCLRMIDRAQAEAPELLVLPEFCNHISWYDDHSHAWRVALALDGEFLRAIAARARQYRCHIVINVSLRGAPGQISVSSLCYDSVGRLCGRADKQTLMGHENTWFRRATRLGDIVEAPFGRFAMFPCRDGVTCETARGLALRGAQLFCDSLNSFALDEASLHVPARAPENKAFLVAANKTGPLIPEAMLDSVAQQTRIPRQFLFGAGESQIVTPEGEVLARGPRDGEAVVVADIDLSQADNKLRPDGTDLFAARRPLLYAPLARESVAPVCSPAAPQITVACLAPAASGSEALAELPALVQQLPADTVLAVLPERFCCEPGAPLDSRHGDAALAAMMAACRGRPDLHLCASLPRQVDGQPGVAAVLVSAAGLVAEQPRLHQVGGDGPIATGAALHTVDLPWGRLAMLSGQDAVFPEIVKVAALAGAHVLALPSRLQEPWEERYGLRSRSAENRLCIVASARPLAGKAGLIADLEREFTLMTEWQERCFDGYINQPLVTEQVPGAPVTVARIHPAAACDKLLSEHTDLLLHRPWKLSAGLASKCEEAADA